MHDTTALRIAMDLMQVPSRARSLRSAPLPEGIPILLQVAAGNEEVTREAACAMDRSADAVRSAAVFFIEQILLSPEADSYRVLGAGPGATNSELRRNMSQLLKRFHPDADRSGYRSSFAARVTLAWQDLKTPARRAAYDASRQDLRPNGARRRDNAGVPAPARDASKPGGRTSGAVSRGTRKRPVGIYRIEQPGPLQRALLFLFGRLGR